MKYDQINRSTVTDYASIAHGMPEYRLISARDIDMHVAYARHEQTRIAMNLVRDGFRWVAARLGAGRTTEA
jgi:hypothetical protein